MCKAWLPVSPDHVEVLCDKAGCPTAERMVLGVAVTSAVAAAAVVLIVVVPSTCAWVQWP